MTSRIQDLIILKTRLRLGVNKLNELSRLVYEIHRRDRLGPEQIIGEKAITAVVENKTMGFLDKFSRIKEYLLKRRFPEAYGQKDFLVFFNKLESFDTQSGRIYQGRFYPEAVFIEEKVKNTALAGRVRKLFPDVKTELIESLKEYRKAQPAGALDLKKRDVVISEQLWDFIKPCPCTKGVVCCNYHIINLGFGCPFDCSYCYLQHYTNSPGLVLDANIEVFKDKVTQYLKKYKGAALRIGTGEFTDSLALDHITGYSRELVQYFAPLNALLELKTKSADISNLIGLNHNEKTVVSWSLNPQSIISAEERGAASLEERLKAAKKCGEEGYKIGFHFDPVIYYPGWDKDYRQVVDAMCDTAADIEWISIGALRFHRSLKSAIERRFPGTDYIYRDMVIGEDKKIRYYEALREEIFKKMYGWIRSRNKKTAIYLCMEPKDMWQKVVLDKPYWM